MSDPSPQMPGRSNLRTLAGRVRSGEILAEDLVRESIRRIEAARALNAVVSMRAEAALDDARALDARIRVDGGASVGPLAGLPLVVKDIEHAAGLPTTFGSLLFADAPGATADGLTSSRLRAAGAILLGKSNVPEFAFEGFTDNRVFGATHNPWAPSWSPGGSSGGAGAAIAAGLVAIATATDVGGSIRIPAALCGLVGLKPSAGRIGRDPILASLDLNNHGPLTSTVDDARLVLEVLSGLTEGDPGSLPRVDLDPPTMPVRAFAAPRLAPFGPLPEGVEQLFTRVIATVAGELQLHVEEISQERIFPSGFDPGDWFRIVGTEQAHALGRATIEREGDRFDPAFRAWLEEALEVDAEAYAGARRRRWRYVLELDRLLEPDAVLLTPTLGVEGWAADGALPGRQRSPLPGHVFNTDPLNLTGHPAVSLPAGRFEASGLPFGLQVVAPRFREDLLFGFALAWEAARPWPLVASGYTPLGS